MKVIGNIVGKRASFSSNNSSNTPSAQGGAVSKAHSDNDRVDKVRGLRSFNRFVEKMKSDYREKVSEVQSHIESGSHDLAAGKGVFGQEELGPIAANQNKASSRPWLKKGKSAKDNTSRSFDDVPSFFGVNDKSQKSDNISREAPLAAFTASKPPNYDSKANKSVDVIRNNQNNQNQQNWSFDGGNGGLDDSFGGHKPMDIEAPDALQDCPQNVLDDCFGFGKAAANESPDGGNFGGFGNGGLQGAETAYILKDVDAGGFADDDILFTGNPNQTSNKPPASTGFGNQHFQSPLPQITQSSGPSFGYASKAGSIELDSADELLGFSNQPASELPRRQPQYPGFDEPVFGGSGNKGFHSQSEILNSGPKFPQRKFARRDAAPSVIPRKGVLVPPWL